MKNLKAYLLSLALILVVAIAQAATLTQAQKNQLKANLAANNVTIVNFNDGQPIAINLILPDTPAGVGDNFERVATWYNSAASPATYAWQFTRTRMENRRAVLNTAGAGNEMDGLAAGKRECLQWALDDTIEPRFSAVRATLDDWCGSQNVLKAAIKDSFKRPLANVEAALKVTPAVGAGTFASPWDGGFQGTVTATDIEDAIRNGQ